jgi:hypothetical protein
VAQVAISRLRSEVAAVLGPPWRALRKNGRRTSPAILAFPRTFPLALTCTAIIGVFALVQHTSTGWWLVEHVAGVYQALPLPLILLRLPLSMFAPAPDLPAWGAMVQVLIVFGFSEIHLGRVRTLVTAICVNGLTTVSARIMVIVGLHLSIGTPQVDQYELDTGPSTVVVALAIYVALARRAYILLAITTGAMAAEVVVLPNLAGREHLVALALGAAAYLIGERVPSHGTRRNTITSSTSTGGTPGSGAVIAPNPPSTPATSPTPPLSPIPRHSPAHRPAPAATAAVTAAPAATADTPRPHAPDATPQRPGSRP